MSLHSTQLRALENAYETFLDLLDKGLIHEAEESLEFLRDKGYAEYLKPFEERLRDVTIPA